MNNIFLIGIAQALFFVALLASKQSKSLSDKVLMAWLGFLAAHLFVAYGDALGWGSQYPHWIGLSFPFPLAEGPFFFLYVLTLTRNPSHLRRTDFLHFLPFLGAYLISLDFYLSSPEVKLHFLKEILWVDPPWSVTAVRILLLLTGPIYASYVLWQVRAHRRKIRDFFSYSDEIDLRWIQYLSIGMLAIWLVVWFVDLSHKSGNFQLQGARLIYVAVTAFIFAIGYFGFKQGRIFSFEKEREATTEQDSEPSIKKYQKSGLKRAVQEELLHKLLHHMEHHQPYLNPQLTLAELALQMEISPHHLSQLINEGQQQNFFEFVNQYRVQAFQKTIEDPSSDKLTLLAIGLDCGFNSKSSFNRTFKQLTGQTPSQYAKSRLPKE